MARKDEVTEATESEVRAPEKTKGVQVANGPTTGYRDAPKELAGGEGRICRANFEDGFLPAGWHDTPAKCKNYSGKGHDDYIKVREAGGKWVSTPGG